MAMRARLWTLSGLATELGCNIRTISAALNDVPADGRVNLRGKAYDGWKIETARKALAARSAEVARKRNGGCSAPDREALRMAGEIETRLADVEALLERLDAEPDVAKRREMVKSQGGCIGALDRALAKSIESDDDMLPIFEPMREKVLGEIVNRVLAATSWKLKAA